ncbi:murein L,D-transpeptidase catalytic domain family protein [Sphingomonas quercus]|nr:murein L,D-transpeptidase catalytic domain family protein [Sphingomonas quercus]
MNDLLNASAVSRRSFLSVTSLGIAGTLSAGRVAAALPAAAATPAAVRPSLMAKAMAALQRHGDAIPNRDLVGIADFAIASGTPRFHLVDMASGRTTTLLVSHGKGSDPSHSGMLQRFSNIEGSEASSSGAYRTGDIYVGKHGRSRRLVGLDPTNCNALGRAIVVHGAWYVSPDIVRQHGKLGRSQGCLAVSTAELEQVLTRLGTGRMIYADKV